MQFRKSNIALHKTAYEYDWRLPWDRRHNYHGCIAISAIFYRLPLRADPFNQQALNQETSALAGIGAGLIGVDVFLARDLALTDRPFKGSSTWLSRDELIHTTVTRKAEKTTQATTIPKITNAMVSSINSYAVSLPDPRLAIDQTDQNRVCERNAMLAPSSGSPAIMRLLAV